ncbi:helix-turn-helix domain-containing protein [Chryseobacterium binzhouense]|uniref:helix-turn-helix domain-containing protein n=1 Tax=Chryseobacterium binzhouense TaxID=2593646 RepID=UPI0011811B84|nr:helix-turn-helix domain-containing protein [Chryseobacterium binzhouense]
MVQLITLSVEDLHTIIKSAVGEALQSSQPRQKENDEDAYLTRQQVSKYLHLSLTTLDTYTKEGLLTSCKIGHRVLYKKSVITTSLQDKINAVKHKSK